MSEDFGVDSMAGRLRRVAMRAPGAILSADASEWHYARPIDGDSLVRQHRGLAELIESHGAEVLWLPDADDGLADSIFAYDPSFMTPAGAVVMRPGKDLRLGEAKLHEQFYEMNDLSIVGVIEAPGTIEGGDCYWLDPTTIAAGLGFRTNQTGIDQLRDVVEPQGIAVKQFDLPYHRGPDACLHLMSVVSPLDTDLALVYAPLVPTALYELMVDMGYELLHASAEEFEASAGLSLNVLATAPRRCIAVAGFRDTAELMRRAGCEVSTFDADELCLPCEGGPTCLTRPILRDGRSPGSQKSSPLGN